MAASSSSWFGIVAKTVLTTVPITIAFLDNVGYVAKVEGLSMQSSLNPNPELPRMPPASPPRQVGHERSRALSKRRRNDFVWINRWASRHHTSIQHGDVVAFTSPTHPERTLIKRVVALEGDSVRMRRSGRPLTVSCGYFWAEGDNWSVSTDSNTFGQVPLGLVAGKATHIVWPPSRWQKINNNSSTSSLQRQWPVIMRGGSQDSPVNVRDVVHRNDVDADVINGDDDGDDFLPMSERSSGSARLTDNIFPKVDAIRFEDVRGVTITS